MNDDQTTFDSESHVQRMWEAAQLTDQLRISRRSIEEYLASDRWEESTPAYAFGYLSQAIKTHLEIEADFVSVMSTLTIA